jgi:coatomer subunit beta'
MAYILFASDDMTIRLFDWDRNFQSTAVFEGHTHYVMCVGINPKDPNTFASASLDRTVKVWGLTSSTPHFSFEGRARGINGLAFFPGRDRPYLASCADDFCVKLWDYQTKMCVATLEGHSDNVSAVLFHPTFPVLISGAYFILFYFIFLPFAFCLLRHFFNFLQQKKKKK